MAFRYYGVFSSTGDPQAFYNNDIYPDVYEMVDDKPVYIRRNDKIPAAAIELTETQWNKFITDQRSWVWSKTANGPVQRPSGLVKDVVSGVLKPLDPVIKA